LASTCHVGLGVKVWLRPRHNVETEAESWKARNDILRIKRVHGITKSFGTAALVATRAHKVLWLFAWRLYILRGAAVAFVKAGNTIPVFTGR